MFILHYSRILRCWKIILRRKYNTFMLLHHKNFMSSIPCDGKLLKKFPYNASISLKDISARSAIWTTTYAICTLTLDIMQNSQPLFLLQCHIKFCFLALLLKTHLIHGKDTNIAINKDLEENALNPLS